MLSGCGDAIDDCVTLLPLSIRTCRERATHIVPVNAQVQDFDDCLSQYVAKVFMPYLGSAAVAIPTSLKHLDSLAALLQPNTLSSYL